MQSRSQRDLLWAIGFSFCMSTTALWAQTPTPAYKDIKLKNGLRVVVMEDHSAPVYAVAVIYDVGSRNELAVDPRPKN